MLEVVRDLKLMSATSAAAIFMGALIPINIVATQDKQEFVLNMLVLLLGCALGWVVGMFASPYTGRESTRFGAFIRAFGAFVSGYILGKLDFISEYFVNPQVVFSYGNEIRFLTFTIALISSFFLAYVYRSYAPNTRLPSNITDMQLEELPQLRDADP